jgi:hypothetical protein
MKRNPEPRKCTGLVLATAVIDNLKTLARRRSLYEGKDIRWTDLARLAILEKYGTTTGSN